MRVYHTIKELNLHLVHVHVKFLLEFCTFYFICAAKRKTDTYFRFFIEPVDKDYHTVSSLFAFSKTRITLFTNFARYPALMNDCLNFLTSAFQWTWPLSVLSGNLHSVT